VKRESQKKAQSLKLTDGLMALTGAARDTGDSRRSPGEDGSAEGTSGANTHANEGGTVYPSRYLSRVDSQESRALSTVNSRKCEQLEDPSLTSEGQSDEW
jgi:hypothetical protein